ncbi:MAG: branched-chain amino acid ABC transporter permease [Deltaproteobacteria bacterium]|nr:branched-chain amino acid ABC transporter permease [Deltaproteobacteria bacterium]
MEKALLLTFIGLGLGSVFGLVGLILVITFNATKVINLAVGEFVMIGALVSAILVKSAHLPLGWSILIIIAGTIVIGLFLNYFLVTPLLDKNVPGIMIIIGTYAGALVVSGSAGALTDFAFVGTPPILPLTSIKIWIFPIVPQYGLCILVTIGVVVAYWYFLNRTHVGWAFKATSINRDMCRLLGISTSRMIAMAFAMSAGIGAIAGLLIGPMSSVNASMGFPVMVNGFIASVLGGMGNPYAAVVGGWVVGILHVLIAGYLAPGYAQLAVFLLLIGILYVRPYGLFGVHED